MRHDATLRSLTTLLVAGAFLATGPAPTDPKATAPAVAVTKGTVEGHPEWRYWDVVPDLARAGLQIGIKDGGAPLSALVPDGALAAINGGYFLKNYKPTGWVLDAAGEHGKRNPKAKGGVLAVRDAKAWIGPMSKVPFTPKFAVQNGPLLLTTDGKVGLRSDDGKRAARTVACLQAKALHLIVIQSGIGNGPTLMETAELLKDPKGPFKCDVALNLDGGSSTGVWLAPELGESSPPIVPIGYGIAVVPKASS